MRMSFLCFSLTVNACQTTPEIYTAKSTHNTKQEGAFYISTTTILPEKFARKPLQNEEIKRLIVPQNMFLIYTISRKNVELREGPGVKFSLMDKSLSQKEPVIVFERRGNWAKVFAYKKNLSGWIHKKTIKKKPPISKNIIIDPQKLPTGIAVRPIKHIFTFPEYTEIKAKIKKGTQFSVLKKTANLALVRINETNSIMWLDREDFK